MGIVGGVGGVADGGGGVSSVYGLFGATTPHSVRRRCSSLFLKGEIVPFDWL